MPGREFKVKSMVGRKERGWLEMLWDMTPQGTMSAKTLTVSRQHSEVQTPTLLLPKGSTQPRTHINPEIKAISLYFRSIAFTTVMALNYSTK